MEKSVNISCTLSFRTQFWATQLMFARSGAGLFIYGIFVGFPMLSFANVLVLDTQYAQWISHPSNWTGLLIMLAFPLLLLPAATAWNIWRARRRNAWLRGVLKFAITPEAFEIHAEGFDARLQWNVLHKVRETKDFFLFYVAPMVAHVVPKACVASPGDMDDIRTIVHAALGSKAKLRAA